MARFFKEAKLYIIFAITLAGIAGVSLTVPLLPALVAEFNLTPQQAGFMMTAYTLPGVLFVMFIGMLSDKYGRKLMIIFSLLLFGFAGGFIFFATSFKQLLMLRFIQGIGGSALPALAVMLVGDMYDERDRLRIMGLNGVALSAGTAFFPLVGGYAALTGWAVPFLLFFSALPLALLVMFYLKEPKRQKSNVKFIDYLRSVKPYLLKAESLLAFSIGFTVFILLYGGLLTYLIIHMGSVFQMDALDIGSYIASASIASAAIASLTSRIKKAIGVRAMLTSGFLLFSLSFILIYMAEERYWLVVALLLFGTAMGLTLPLVQTMVTSAAPVNFRGIMVSIFAMTIRLGQTFGPLLLGLLLVFGDIPLIFLVSATFAFLFAVIMLFAKSMGKVEV